MDDLHSFFDKYRKDYEWYHKYLESHNHLIRDLERQIKPLSKIIEETLRSIDYKKIIEDHKWLISQSAYFIKSLNQQYDIFQSFKNSTFLNLIEEATLYQNNWKRTLEIFNNNISGLASQILYDVINIDEFVKVEISEATAAPEVSFSDVIQGTGSINY